VAVLHRTPDDRLGFDLRTVGRQAGDPFGEARRSTRPGPRTPLNTAQNRTPEPSDPRAPRTGAPICASRPAPSAQVSGQHQDRRRYPDMAGIKAFVDIDVGDYEAAYPATHRYTPLP
jgi:hypothetical protein